jgi:hypothetical protein
MRVWLAAAIATLSCVGPTAWAAADPAWKSLSYFEYELYELGIGTNASWTNAHTLPGKREGFVPRGFLPSWARDRGEKFDAVWLDDCRAGRSQAASFRRAFYAPGDASLVKGWLSFADPDPARSGITSARVLLNGIVIAAANGHRKGTNQIGAQLNQESELPAARKAFRFGLNTLEIRVKRRAQTPSGSGPPRCGISFGFRANFVADMELGRSTQSAQQAMIPRHAKFAPGASVGARLTAAVRNDGPATSLAGRLVLSVASSMTPRGVIVQGSGKFNECAHTVIEKWLYTFECPYVNWQPGEPGALTILLSAIATDAVNYGEQSITVTLSLGGAGGRDAPPGGIDYAPVTFVACGPTATADGCKNPKGWGDPKT